MRESLADSLVIAARHLPAMLVPRKEKGRLGRLAGRLAPVHVAGFEIRLSGARSRVDFQQCIEPSGGGPQRLAEYIRASGLGARPAWRRIADFMRVWPNSRLAGCVVECWLEYEPAADGLAAPSVFLSLGSRAGGDESAQAIDYALAWLQPRATVERFSRAAREIAGRLPGGARIADIGVMARRPRVLRVNVGVGSAADARRTLAALRRDAAARARVTAIAQGAEPFAREFKVALDWRGGLLPRVGLEIYPCDGADWLAPIAANARWRRALDWLRASGLCEERVAAALAVWPGEDSPPECAGRWPRSLMLESLVRGERAFSLIGRRLSHVKIDLVPGQPTAAKGYFGYLPLWHAASSAPPAPVRATRLRRVVARGAAFLLSRRGARGLWRDFHEVDGGSDNWLSAYVAAALAGTGLPAARDAARKTWELLTGLGTGPGWGYSEAIPVDSDSSLWALRLAAAFGRLRDPAARAALALVRQHRARDGGVASFLPGQLGAMRSARLPRAIAGWCGAHAEVTAAAGALPGFGRSSAAWLLRAQKPDGRWRTYWYDEDAFATALAAEHLAGRPNVVHRRALERAARWAAARIEQDGSVAVAGIRGGSAFAAACCLRILLAAPRSDGNNRAMRGLVAWLAAAQLSGGGWSSSAPLRKTLPADRHPEASGARLGFSWDGERLFTTATVLVALGRFAARKVRG